MPKMLYVVLDDSVKSLRFRDRLLPKLQEKIEVTVLDPTEAKAQSLGDYLAWFPLIFKRVDQETPEFFGSVPANWDDDYLIKPAEGCFDESDILEWYQGDRCEDGVCRLDHQDSEEKDDINRVIDDATKLSVSIVSDLLKESFLDGLERLGERLKK